MNPSFAWRSADWCKWQRAETLGALVNGVFLVALCLSIFLEAIQRFVEPQVVSNPMLVLIVGCFGLLSNILGLFLFHDHGHGHDHDHGHAKGDDVTAAEEGHNQTAQVADESGNIIDVLPSTIVGAGQNRKIHQRHNSGSRRRFASADNINIHPASFRNDIIAASRLEGIESGNVTESENEEAVEGDDDLNTEASPLLHKKSGSVDETPKDDHRHSRSDSWHTGHKHNEAKGNKSKGGHDLNMRGVFLHVMGDALGNIGVIASALIIWLTPFWWRFYSDPLISLVITIIILASAIPLCKAASRILLQAVPPGISVEDIKDDIQELPGIISCHHVHVWQLSDTKMVASLHVQVGFDFKGEGSARYMKLARAVRKCLHAYGIHSSTIQPEFCLDPKHSEGEDDDHHHLDGRGRDENGAGGLQSKKSSRSTTRSKRWSRAGSARDEETVDECLLECGDECGDGGQQCCRPGTGSVKEDHHSDG